jgi:hypothetical protein
VIVMEMIVALLESYWALCKFQGPAISDPLHQGGTNRVADVGPTPCQKHTGGIVVCKRNCRLLMACLQCEGCACLSRPFLAVDKPLVPSRLKAVQSQPHSIVTVLLCS